jgi:hypothetical protein
MTAALPGVLSSVDSVSLTRESAVFQSIASAIERELVLRGVDVDAQAVDVALNERIAQAATTYALGEQEAMEKMSHLAVVGYLADELTRGALSVDDTTVRGVPLESHFDES